jgi:copper chaperone
MTTVQYNVSGMSCSGCVRSVERALQAQPGVEAVAVDLEASTASVTYDETVTDADTLERVIGSLGFTVVSRAGRH